MDRPTAPRESLIKPTKRRLKQSLREVAVAIVLTVAAVVCLIFSLARRESAVVAPTGDTKLVIKRPS